MLNLGLAEIYTVCKTVTPIEFELNQMQFLETSTPQKNQEAAMCKDSFCFPVKETTM